MAQRVKSSFSYPGQLHIRQNNSVGTEFSACKTGMTDIILSCSFGLCSVPLQSENRIVWIYYYYYYHYYYYYYCALAVPPCEKIDWTDFFFFFFL